MEKGVCGLWFSALVRETNRQGQDVCMPRRSVRVSEERLCGADTTTHSRSTAAYRRPWRCVLTLTQNGYGGGGGGACGRREVKRRVMRGGGGLP